MRLTGSAGAGGGMRAFIASLIGGIIIAMLGAGVARAEDFSVHLDTMAELDASRPVPEYTLDKVVTGNFVDDGIPSKSYDVFIRFKEFGDVRLDEGNDVGPSEGGRWRKGMTFNSGLADLAGVKAGWIKDAPDLFIVAWEVEPDMRGTAHDFYHAFVLLRLNDRRAEVLIRGNRAMNTRVVNLLGEFPLESPRFSFDKAHGQLIAALTRYEDLASPDARPLFRPAKDEAGKDRFVAAIREKITIRYRYADGGLVPVSCRLTYRAQDKDDLTDVARFYLGPNATRRELLDANPALAARYKDAAPDAMVSLPADTEVAIPVPARQLVDRYCRGVTAPKKPEPATPLKTP